MGFVPQADCSILEGDNRFQLKRGGDLGDLLR
jgi:hypothetical protein